MATPEGSASDKEIKPIEDEEPPDEPGGSSGETTDSSLPSKEELAGALGVAVDDPKVAEALGEIRIRQMYEEAARRQAEEAARQEAAAAEAARQEAEAVAKQNQYTVEYDDPFTGEHIVETREKPPEWSSPAAASEAKIMLETQELIRQGVTREKLETEGYSTTTSAKFGDSEYTITHIARPDGRMETIETRLDPDGDGTVTTRVTDSLAGSGISIVEERLEDGIVVDRRVLREAPGVGGTVPVAGPVAPAPPEMPDVSQEDVDAFVDAIAAGGPTTEAGRALLDQIDQELGLNPGPLADLAGGRTSSGSAAPGTTSPSGGPTSTAPSQDGGSSTGSGPLNDPFEVRDPFASSRDNTGSGGSDAGTGGGGDVGTGPTTPSGGSSTPMWQGALDDLSAGSPAEPDGVAASGSRGDGGGVSLPGPIGPLGTASTGIGGTTDAGSEGPLSGGSQGGPEDTDGSGPAIPFMSEDGESIDHFERTNADGSKTIMTADGKEVFTVPPASEGKDESSSTDDDTNSDTDSTDDDSDNDDSGDDTADDADSEEATAYVDPDADTTGGWRPTAADISRTISVLSSDGAHGGDTVNPDLWDGPDISGPPPDEVEPGSEDPHPDAGDSEPLLTWPRVLPGDAISHPLNPSDGPGWTPELDPATIDDPLGPVSHGDAFVVGDVALHDVGAFGQAQFTPFGAELNGSDAFADGLDTGLDGGALDLGGPEMLDGPDQDGMLEGPRP